MTAGVEVDVDDGPRPGASERGRCIDRLRTHRGLIGAMVVGTSLRLTVLIAGYGASDRRFTFADSASYLQVARSLPSALWSDRPQMLEATLLRPPGYPTFLAAMFGGSGGPITVVVIQVLVGGAVNVALCHRLALRCFGAGAALPAALFLALDPVSMAFSLLIATETVFTTALLGMLLSVERVTAERSATWVRWTALAGGCLAACALVRPVMVYFIPLLAVLIAAGQAPDRLRRIALAVVVAGVPIGAWMARNQILTGTLIYSTAGGQNMIEFGTASVLAERGQTSFGSQTKAEAEDYRRAGEELLAPHRDELRSADSIERSRVWSTVGLEAIARHPRGYVVMAGQGMARTLLGPGDTALADVAALEPGSGARSVLRIWCIAWLGSLALLAAWGLARQLRGGRRQLVLLGVPIVYLLVLSSGPNADARFRVPLAPMLCILAGAGVAAIRARRSPRQTAP